MTKEGDEGEADVGEGEEGETLEDPTGRFVRTNKQLGCGSTKLVYQARDEEEGVDVAWSEIDVTKSSEHVLEKMNNEIQVLESIHHPNIINLQCSWYDEERDTLTFITEMMPGGTLKSFIKQSKKKRLKLKVIKRICRQLLSALQYLHTRDPPIMHRDLKCDNIFIDAHNCEVKIGDFGLSGNTGYHKSTTHRIEFVAPEVFQQGCNYSSRGDVYSFGMCVLEMVTGEYPYEECNNNEEVREKVIRGETPLVLQTFDVTDYTTNNTDAREFILNCLESVNSRPDIQELFNSAFLKEDENGSLSKAPATTPEGRPSYSSADLQATRYRRNSAHSSLPPSEVSNTSTVLLPTHTVVLKVESEAGLATDVSWGVTEPSSGTADAASPLRPSLRTPQSLVDSEGSQASGKSQSPTEAEGVDYSDEPLSSLCCQLGNGSAIQKVVDRETEVVEALRQLEKAYLEKSQRLENQILKVEKDLEKLTGTPASKPKISKTVTRSGQTATATTTTHTQPAAASSVSMPFSPPRSAVSPVKNMPTTEFDGHSPDICPSPSLTDSFPATLSPNASMGGPIRPSPSPIPTSNGSSIRQDSSELIHEVGPGRSTPTSPDGDVPQPAPNGFAPSDSDAKQKRQKNAQETYDMIANLALENLGTSLCNQQSKPSVDAPPQSLSIK